VFGVCGELRLHLHNPNSDLLSEQVSVRLIDSDGARYEVSCVTRPGAGKRIIGRFDGVDTRELAASLKGVMIALPKTLLPRPAEDEFYLHEIVGAKVWADGTERGELIAVHSTANHEVFEVRTDTGVVFVPALREFVLEVDLSQGRIDVVAECLEIDS
jgi:16S rRNA processing protein RimM